MKRYCLTLDLKNDEALIAEYEAHHKKLLPEILDSIRDAGITDMVIYRHQNRLCMIMETEDDFDFDMKNKMDAQNPEVQKWEDLMWKYQQPIAGSARGEKWIIMNPIFNLKET